MTPHSLKVGLLYISPMETPRNDQPKVTVITSLGAKASDAELATPEVQRFLANMRNLADPAVIESIRDSGPYRKRTLRGRFNSIIVRLTGLLR